MYSGSTGTQNDFDALGLPGALVGSFADKDLEVWPEHWPALEMFAALATQWRVGMNGATGLDYAAVPVVMDMHGIAPEDRRERFDELRTMERAALDVMAEKVKKT